MDGEVIGIQSMCTDGEDETYDVPEWDSVSSTGSGTAVLESRRTK